MPPDPNPQPRTVIEFRDVVKRFGATAAVDRVSFSVGAGEIVSLLGPSGCGKTTTLRLISGFENPDAGSIEISGASVVGKRPYERNVGLLFQHYAWAQSLGVKWFSICVDDVKWTQTPSVSTSELPLKRIDPLRLRMAL